MHKSKPSRRGRLYGQLDHMVKCKRKEVNYKKK